MEKWVDAVEAKLSSMQAQIAGIVRLQRYLVEGHLKLHEDRVTVCREHMALFECLSSEGVVSRNVLMSYFQAEKISDQFHGCLHDPQIAQLVVRSLGMVAAGRLSTASPTCRQHVLGCVPPHPLEASEVDLPLSMALLLRCFPSRRVGVETPLSDPCIAQTVVSIAGKGVIAGLSAASRFCSSSLKAATPKQHHRNGVYGGPSFPVKNIYMVLSVGRAATAISQAIGISAHYLAGASCACKESMSTRLQESPVGLRMKWRTLPRKPGFAQPPAKKILSILNQPRIALAIRRAVGHTLPAAASRWCFSCLHSIPAITGIMSSDSARESRRNKPPEPVYRSAGGLSGPSFASAIDFEGAVLPAPPLSLAARIRTSLRTCQVIAGWGSADGCASAELRVRSGNLEYMERFGMWWGWKSVTSCDSIDLADGEWHGVSAVRLQSGKVSLYADSMLIGEGWLESSVPTGLMPSAKSAHLHRSWNGYAFNGEIGPLFVFDCALSLEQLCLLGIFPSKDEKRVGSRELNEIWSSLKAMEAELEHSSSMSPRRRAGTEGSAFPASSSQHLSFIPPMLETCDPLSFAPSPLLETDHGERWWSMNAQAMAMIDALHCSDSFAEAERQRQDSKAGRVRGCF